MEVVPKRGGLLSVNAMGRKRRQPERMERAAKAGALYCAVVFAAGFVLGVLRVLLVAPLAGELAAVAVEAPVMLAVTWTTCGWLTDRLDVSQRFLDRLLIGGVALVLLAAAEATVALATHGDAAQRFLESQGRTAVLLGLTAQLAFAVFPWLQRRGQA